MAGDHKYKPISKCQKKAPQILLTKFGYPIVTNVTITHVSYQPLTSVDFDKIKQRATKCSTPLSQFIQLEVHHYIVFNFQPPTKHCTTVCLLFIEPLLELMKF